LEGERIPRPGEIYNHFKDKPYQIISVATHSETGERMVVYQALYGDFGTYVRPLTMFVSEVDHGKYPEAIQKNRFELYKPNNKPTTDGLTVQVNDEDTKEIAEEGSVNSILLEFLEATSYTRKLNVITSNAKHLSDRLINDMAVSLDCAIDEGPIEKRSQELIACLQAMCRFEDRRLR